MLSSFQRTTPQGDEVDGPEAGTCQQDCERTVEARPDPRPHSPFNALRNSLEIQLPRALLDCRAFPRILETDKLVPSSARYSE
ncbi:hypothetical protein BaRGS_00017551 [Batillaria attramentaria]|uniref:Uncharacterized protein n=1 Tax=Batillaria attramentaria TaxID=370345 RepID=A0ABD0KW08_9CAEN